MPEERVGISRRLLFKLAGATAAAAGLVGHGAKTAAAHDLKPSDPAYRYDEYEAIVNRRDARIRQLYQWPNIKNEIIFPNVRNGLNGFQFSYDLPPNSIQVVVQAYGTANAATYDDFIWEKYKLGERMGINDPDTGEPALRNIWYTSSVAAEETPEAPEERDDPYYADASIEGLQRRGLLVLIWHQTIHAHARAAATNQWGPDDQTEEEILAEIEEHLIPGAILIPAAVGELVFLQDKGYRLVVNH